ncbi:DoxX family protein [Propionibacteriaceae bacterium Y2011]|uniref:DoxX family protein n=1 Tax=Microlunatus sp. Y2014 TaxID=3418488 RepID=UPI003B4E1ABE
MAGFLKGLQDLVLLIARICLGVVLISRGWRRWQDTGVDWQADYLAQFGTPYAEYAAWGATVLEIVGGIFLIVGALTPLIALAIVVEQVLIIVWTKWFRGLALHSDVAGTGYEYTVITACLALVFLVFGAGRLSVDRLFRRSPDTEQDPYDEYAAP